MRVEERAFDVAYFWRIDPAVAAALPLSVLARYEEHAVRIAKTINHDRG